MNLFNRKYKHFNVQRYKNVNSVPYLDRCLKEENKN